MADKLTKSLLRTGHQKALGFPSDSASPRASALPLPPDAPDFIQTRAEDLQSIPPPIVKKSWFTMAHLLLDPGATVLDMGCQDGMMAYTMACLRPELRVIGMDKNTTLIQNAKKSWARQNLSFVSGDFNKDVLEPNSVDAIVNSFILHEIYSESSFNSRTVYSSIANQVKLIKPGGYMLLRDYAKPEEPEFVLMEFQQNTIDPRATRGLTEAELLISFSENARPRVDNVSPGFYLEELPPRFPNTRLFRLRHKWAYEFMMRNHDRALWDSELPKQYTFFTQRDYKSTLSGLGMRIVYAAPLWDDHYIGKYFQGHFNLYDDNYTPLSYPPTSYVILAQKIDENSSQVITERRQSRDKPDLLHVTALRNEANGKITEIVSSDQDFAEIIPYRYAENNRIFVYLREGVLRGLVNTVRRQAHGIDDKFWSGHMVEAINIDIAELEDVKPNDLNAVSKYAMQRFNLKPAYGRGFEAGPILYPDPHSIGERIETLYLNVETDTSRIALKDGDVLHAYDIQAVLNAIAVGLIPSGRLEVQLLTLLRHLNIPPERWSESPLVIEETDGGNILQSREIMARMADDDKRFKEIRGTVGKIRVLNSVFVEEGRSKSGTVKSISAHPQEFAMMDEGTMNVAVVLPLSRDFSGEVMAGVNVEYAPVPQRYQGNGLILTAPSFVLPKEVQTIEDARRFIAAKYEVKIENVGRMGESYFSYIGMMPKRIFPFAVTGVKRKVYDGFAHGATALAPLKDLWKMHYYDCDLNNLITKIGEVFSMHQASIDYTMVKNTYGFSAPLAPALSAPASVVGDTLGAIVPRNLGSTDTASAAATSTPHVTGYSAPSLDFGPGGGLPGLSGKKSGGKNGGKSSSGGVGNKLRATPTKKTSRVQPAPKPTPDK